MVAFVVLVCTAGWLASTAAACHSEITASINCNGVVSYTATAWTGTGATPTARTNSDVRVWASTNGGSSFTQVGSGHFGSDNSFSFSGSFSAGSASSVVVKVQETAHWGTGDAPSAARTTTVSKQGCGTTPTPTTTTTTTPTPTKPTPKPTPTPPAPPVVQVVSLKVQKLERVGSTGDFVAGSVAVTVGQSIAYQIVVTDTGTTMLTLTLLDGLCNTGTLSPAGPQTVGATGSVSYTCTHLATAADIGTLTNTATATGVAGDGTKVTGTATAVANVTAAAVTAPAVTAAALKSGVLGKSATKKAAVKHAHAAVKATHVKKVTAKSKPAHAVAQSAHFTG